MSLSAAPRALHEGIVEEMRGRIVNMKLAPGEKIDERAWCERLSVSRTPFREAMRVLAAEGLVTITPRRGVRVAPLTADDLAETFPILGALEALAAELACDRLTALDLDRLSEMQAAMTAAHEAGDRDAYFRLNEAIHAAIREAAGNPSLIRMIEGFSTRIRRARFMANLGAARWAEALDEHAAILAALRARERVQVGKLMTAHIANKHAALTAALGEAEERLSGAGG